MGALTAKPLSFRARPWELRTVETTDIVDGETPALQAQLHGRRIHRILPRSSSSGPWISDRTRFFSDALAVQRLDAIHSLGAILAPATDHGWPRALDHVAEQVHRRALVLFPGRYLDLQSGHSLAHLPPWIYSLVSAPPVSDLDFFSKPPVAGPWSGNHIFLGTCLRLEAPLTNLALRRCLGDGQTQAVLFGASSPAGPSPTVQAGGQLADFLALVEGRHPLLRRFFRSSAATAVWVGDCLRRRRDGHRWQRLALQLQRQRPHWRVLASASNVTQSTCQELGLGSSATEGWRRRRRPLAVWTFGSADHRSRSGDPLVSWTSHVTDPAWIGVSLGLPVAAPLEKVVRIMGSDGLVRTTHPTVPQAGDRKEDWQILRALAIQRGVGHPAMLAIFRGANRPRDWTLPADHTAPTNDLARALLVRLGRSRFRLDRTPAGRFLGHPHAADGLLRLSPSLALGLALARTAGNFRFPAL